MKYHTKYLDWPFCDTIFPLYDKRSIEGGSYQVRTRYEVGCWWLLAVVFVSAATTPCTSAHSKHGAAFQNTSRRQRENIRSKHTCKNDSKPSVNKKPDIWKRTGVRPIKNMRLTSNMCFLLAGLYPVAYYKYVQQIYSYRQGVKLSHTPIIYDAICTYIYEHLSETAWTFGLFSAANT